MERATSDPVEAARSIVRQRVIALLCHRPEDLRPCAQFDVSILIGWALSMLGIIVWIGFGR